jgi:hypothetical protein
MGFSRFLALLLDRNSKGNTVTPSLCCLIGRSSHVLTLLSLASVGDAHQEYLVRTLQELLHACLRFGDAPWTHISVLDIRADIQHQNGNFTAEFAELWEDVDSVGSPSLLPRRNATLA